eukprot:275416_1
MNHFVSISITLATLSHTFTLLISSIFIYIPPVFIVLFEKILTWILHVPYANIHLVVLLSSWLWRITKHSPYGGDILYNTIHIAAYSQHIHQMTRKRFHELFVLNIFSVYPFPKMGDPLVFLIHGF